MNSAHIKFWFLNAVCVSLLTQLESATFSASPKDITPQKTMSVSLRCEPGTDSIGAILAIHIKKKDEAPGAGNDTKSSAASSEAKEATRRDTKDNFVRATITAGDKITVLPPLNRRLILNIPIKKKDEAPVTGYDTKSSAASSEIEELRAFSYAGPSVWNPLPLHFRRSPTFDTFRNRFLTEGTVVGSAAYLMVSIQAPDVYCLGLYECQVTQFDEEGNVKVTTEVTEVREVIELSLDTLQMRVKTLEGQLPVIKIIAETLAKTMQEAKTNTALLEQDVTALKKENQELNDVVSSLTNQLRELTSRVDLLYSGKAEINAGPAKDDVDFSKLTDLVQQSQTETAKRDEELSRMKERLEDIESTRIHVLEEQMQTVRDREKYLEDLSARIDFKINTSFEPRLKELEKINWKELSENLEDLRGNTIPVLVQNITDAQQSISKLQNSVTLVHDQSGLTSGNDNSGNIVTTAFPTFDGPACYVCGDNSTQKPCTSKTSNNAQECPQNQPECMTDVYQNGVFRRIYRRCVTQNECQASVRRSSPQCMEDSFMEVRAMECHFCCTSQLCNDFIRPSKDLVT